jgi:hypothetical protein
MFLCLGQSITFESNPRVEDTPNRGHIERG